MLPNPCDICEHQSAKCVNGNYMCQAWKYYIRVNWAEICGPFRRMAERKKGGTTQWP
jgi:hypothetical protein